LGIFEKKGVENQDTVPINSTNLAGKCGSLIVHIVVGIGFGRTRKNELVDVMSVLNGLPREQLQMKQVQQMMGMNTFVHIYWSRK